MKPQTELATPVPTADDVAALQQQLEKMGQVDPKAEAFLAALAGALFPDGNPTLEQLTWTAKEAHSAQAAEGVTAEERLKAAEQRFRTLVEQIPAVVFFAVLGEGRNEIYVSPHIEQMLGFSQQEWLESPFLWFWQLHPDDRDLWNAEFTRGIQTGGPFRGECRVFARDGRVVWVHGEARLIKDANGRPMMLQGVAFDITESKRAEALLVTETARQARIEEELAIAQRLQTSILPRKIQVAGLEISAAMLPAEMVGGDYYDVHPFEGGAWLCIGDVSGHGLYSGLIMLMVQSAAAALARSPAVNTPSDVVMQLNEIVYDNIRSRLASDQHVTLSILKYTEDGRVVFAGAHEELLICRRATGKIEQLPTPGAWVGAMRDIRRATIDSSFTLDDGDLLVLYTDGVTEAMNAQSQQFDIHRFRETIEAVHTQSCEAIRDHVLAEVKKWMAVQEDDITLMVIRYRAPSSRSAVKASAPAVRSVRVFPAQSLFEGRRDGVNVPELSREPARRRGLGASTRTIDQTLLVTLTGMAEAAERAGLSTLLAALHELVLERGLKVIELDVRPLSFLNSMCVKELVGWLSKMAAVPGEKQYRLRVVANSLIPWQRSTFHALSEFAPELFVD